MNDTTTLTATLKVALQASTATGHAVIVDVARRELWLLAVQRGVTLTVTVTTRRFYLPTITLTATGEVKAVETFAAILDEWMRLLNA